METSEGNTGHGSRRWEHPAVYAEGGWVLSTTTSRAMHSIRCRSWSMRSSRRWKEVGYDSPAAAAQDWGNLQAAHWICNEKKSNKLGVSTHQIIKKINIADGEW